MALSYFFSLLPIFPFTDFLQDKNTVKETLTEVMPRSREEKLSSAAALITNWLSTSPKTKPVGKYSILSLKINKLLTVEQLRHPD